jgi:hypothetical protein
MDAPWFSGSLQLGMKQQKSAELVSRLLPHPVKSFDPLFENPAYCIMVTGRRKIFHQVRNTVGTREQDFRKGRQTLNASNADPRPYVTPFVCGVVVQPVQMSIEETPDHIWGDIYVAYS